MDLNFADPPIPPDWHKFEPGIPAGAAPAALARVAADMRSNEVLNTAFTAEQLEPAAAYVEDPPVVATYATGVPMVARFLTIELDTEHEIGKGIGRAARGDPPPRFGAKYRKRLRDPEVSAEVAAALEKLAVHGFAVAAAVNATVDDPAGLRKRDLPDRWRLLVRNLGPTWHGFVEQFNMDPDAPNPLGLLMFGVMQPAGDEYALLVERLALGRRRPFGTTRAVTYMHFFLALGALVFDSGIDRAAGATD